jgi:hypothetical protein
MRTRLDSSPRSCDTCCSRTTSAGTAQSRRRSRASVTATARHATPASQPSRRSLNQLPSYLFRKRLPSRVERAARVTHTRAGRRGSCTRRRSRSRSRSTCSRCTCRRRCSSRSRCRRIVHREARLALTAVRWPTAPVAAPARTSIPRLTDSAAAVVHHLVGVGRVVAGVNDGAVRVLRCRLPQSTTAGGNRHTPSTTVQNHTMPCLQHW